MFRQWDGGDTLPHWVVWLLTSEMSTLVELLWLHAAVSQPMIPLSGSSETDAMLGFAYVPHCVVSPLPFGYTSNAIAFPCSWATPHALLLTPCDISLKWTLYLCMFLFTLKNLYLVFLFVFLIYKIISACLGVFNN